MNTFEKIINFLASEMQTPGLYGVFHIISLVIIAVLTIVLCWACRNCSEKTFKWLIASAWIVMVVFEIYKEIVMSFNNEGGKVYWDYQWHTFPFQLCSLPLYLLPFIAFKKPGKFRDCIMAFMSSFVLFGGLSTILVPTTVFIPTIGVNIQTMVHHGIQVVLGVFILVHERKRINLKFFIPAIYVFLVAVAVALAMNFIFPTFLDEKFAMFYISPYYPCVIPVLDIIYANTHYAVFLLLYIIGLTLVAFLTYLICYGFIKLGMRGKARKQ